MMKELKKTKRTMSEQKENINKEMKIIKQNQIEILKLSSKITEIKNLLEGFNRFEQAEQIIRKVKDKTIAIFQSEEKGKI